MPKKFATENPKATAARERKQAAKEVEELKKQRELQNEYWQDDDKHNKKKQQRKEEQERKRDELLTRKAQAKQQLDAEMNHLTMKNNNDESYGQRVTRAQIQQYKNETVNAKNNIKKISQQVTIAPPIVENLNHLQSHVEEARNIDEALKLLDTTCDSTSVSTLLDKHPEKRMKAAYMAFEDAQLPIYKKSHPTMRLSQLKQLIYKDWQKSPENQFNKQ